MLNLQVFVEKVESVGQNDKSDDSENTENNKTPETVENTVENTEPESKDNKPEGFAEIENQEPVSTDSQKEEKTDENKDSNDTDKDVGKTGDTTSLKENNPPPSSMGDLVEPVSPDDGELSSENEEDYQEEKKEIPPARYSPPAPVITIQPVTSIFVLSFLSMPFVLIQSKV